MRKLFTAATIVVLASAGLVACGGDDDEKTGDGDSTTTASTDETTDDTSTGNDALDELLAKAQDARYRVVYESSDGEQTIIAQDPPRYAYLSGSSGTYGTADDQVVSCSGIDDPATAQCSVLPGLDGSYFSQLLTSGFGAGFAGLLAAADQGDGVFGSIETSDEEIAGRDARCATIDPGASPLIPATGSVTVCVDTETGVTLRFSGEDANGDVEQTLEAVEFGDPSDADLDPPAEPVEITIPTIPT